MVSTTGLVSLYSSVMFHAHFRLEDLFFDNGVDLIIEAHEHSYERFWPMHRGHVTAKNYENPTAPVHIISGAAGCNDFDGLCLDPILAPRGLYYYLSTPSYHQSHITG